jgi:UDP-N-acetyl-2-amino-2-deoxyglucuronate dehydrogenase
MGCGRIAQRHADLLGNGRIPGMRLSAVSDVIPDRARVIGERYGVPHFADVHEMFAAAGPEIQVLSILTPSGLHASHLLEVAGYGRHIVVEKPMALRLEDADRMIRACDENEIKLFIVKQNRFNVPVQKLRRAVEAGRFGKMVLGTVRVRWCRSQEYYDQDEWRGTWAYDGGVLTNQASHHIDLLEWMMGEVDSVFARGATRLVDIETEDTAVVAVRFTNGALGIIEATTATRPTDLEGSLSILGEHGTVEIGGFAVNEMKIWNFAERDEDDDEVLQKFSVNPPDVYGFGHQAYYEHVADCIASGGPQLVDGLEGRRSLELISAIYESIETGRDVSLRFRPKECRLGLR